MTIGIYHIFEANRKALRMVLGLGFNFEEIEHWKDIQTTPSKLIVIFAPDFLPTGVSITQFKHLLEKLDKTLIIVTYNIEVWKMDRNRIFYLDRPDEHKTIDSLRRLLIQEINTNKTGNSKDNLKCG